MLADALDMLRRFERWCRWKVDVWAVLVAALVWPNQFARVISPVGAVPWYLWLIAGAALVVGAASIEGREYITSTLREAFARSRPMVTFLMPVVGLVALGLAGIVTGFWIYVILLGGGVLCLCLGLLFKLPTESVNPDYNSAVATQKRHSLLILGALVAPTVSLLLPGVTD